MKKIVIILTLSVILIGCGKSLIFRNSLINQPSYEQFGNVPQRNFFYPFAISDSLKEIWRADGYGSNSNTSVTVYSEIVFSPELAGNIVGFNSQDGRELGAKKERGEIAHAAVIDRMRLIFGITEIKETFGTLYFYDFIKGINIKEIEIEGGVSNELIKLEDGIIIVSDHGEVIKFDFLGSEIWRTKTNALTISDPASNGTYTVFGNSDGEIIAINNANGKIKYQIKKNIPFESGVIILEDKFFLANNNGEIFCFDIESGLQIWTFNSQVKIVMTPILDDEKIYFGNLNGNYFALDKSNGNMIWKYQTSGVFNASGIVFDNLLIQPDLNRSLLLIDKSNGEIVKKINYDQKVKMSPVFYNGIIYVGIDRGEIIAYKPEIKK